MDISVLIPISLRVATSSAILEKVGRESEAWLSDVKGLWKYLEVVFGATRMLCVCIKYMAKVKFCERLKRFLPSPKEIRF